MWKKTQDLNTIEVGQDTTESVIGPSVHLEGNFTSSGNISIGGSLSGSLTTSGNVTVQEGAKVQAMVSAVNVFVSGEVRGDIRASERLELSPTACIIGNVEAKTLTVTAGAMKSGKTDKAEAVLAKLEVKGAKQTMAKTMDLDS